MMNMSSPSSPYSDKFMYFKCQRTLDTQNKSMIVILIHDNNSYVQKCWISIAIVIVIIAIVHKFPQAFFYNCKIRHFPTSKGICV